MSDELLNQLNERKFMIRRVSRMIPAEGVLDEQTRVRVISNVSIYLREHPDLTNAALAKRLGVSQAYISRILSGQHTGIAEETIDAIVRGLNNAIEEHANREQRDAEFLNAVHATSVATRLRTIAENLRTIGAVGCAYGPAGIGKSLCAQALQAEDRLRTIYVCIRRGNKTVSSLVRSLYDAARSGRTVSAPSYDLLANELRGSRRLLIIDQAHRLTPSALELVFDLHDECQVPVLLLATVQIVAKISADADPFFGQISSRVACRRNLLPEITSGSHRGRPKQWISVADIRAIFRHAELKLHPDAAKRLRDIANYEIGHLRRAMWVFQWAAEIAKVAKHAEINVDDVQRALKQVDDEALDDAFALVDAQRRRQVAAG